jgi:hypothetical protein
MRNKLYGMLILLGLSFLAACASGQAASPTAQQKASPVPETVAPTVTATVPAVVGPGSSECLACHTDKQSLIDTAQPVVATESESKGVG